MFETGGMMAYFWWRLFVLTALAGISAVPLLTPFGAAATAVPSNQTSPTNGILITEVQYDPPGLDVEREWIELFNPGDQPYELSGYGLGDEEAHGGGEGMLRFPNGIVLNAGEVFVVAQTAKGFRSLYGFNPDYEIQDTDSTVSELIADKQWANGTVGLANDGDELLLINENDQIVDALNYGEKNTFFRPGIPAVVAGQSIERIPADCDSDSAVDWRSQRFPTPGVVQAGGDCAAPPVDEILDTPNLRSIGEIQGFADSAALLNQTVTFRGIVTGTLEDQNASGIIFHTLFVQDVPGNEDGDSTTSDAIAVFLGRQRPFYEVGDLISVTGQVTEFFDLTEIDDTGLIIEKIAAGQMVPEPVTLELPEEPLAATTYLEALEGMVVDTEGLLPVLGPTHSGCGFAVGSTSDVQRPIRHTGRDVHSPLILVLNNSDVDCSDLPGVKTGDLLAGIEGPLTYHFDRYKVVQQLKETLRVEPAAAATPSAPPGESLTVLRVATLNLNDYMDSAFEMLDPNDGRPLSTNLAVKRRKLAFTISSTLGCPELIGVQEVETAELLAELAEAAAETCGFMYQVSHLDSADARGIDVALLSNPQRVIIHSMSLHQACSSLETGVLDRGSRCPPQEHPLFSRPPLAVDAQVDGEPLAVIVNHFKSKRGGEAITAPRRMEQAAHVHDLVEGRLNDNPQAAIIVLGDFNDYNQTPLWQQLQEGGVLYDTSQHFPPQSRYNYIFDGQSQLIDGILVSPALVHRIAAVTIPHINADFPINMAGDESPDTIPFRSSDHDPVMLILNSPSSETAQETAEPVSNRNLMPATRPAAATQPMPQSASVPKSEPPSTPTASVTDESSTVSLIALLIAAVIMLVTVLFFAARKRA